MRLLLIFPPLYGALIPLSEYFLSGRKHSLALSLFTASLFAPILVLHASSQLTPSSQYFVHSPGAPFNRHNSMFSRSDAAQSLTTPQSHANTLRTAWGFVFFFPHRLRITDKSIFVPSFPNDFSFSSPHVLLSFPPLCRSLALREKVASGKVGHPSLLELWRDEDSLCGVGLFAASGTNMTAKASWWTQRGNRVLEKLPWYKCCSHGSPGGVQQ